VEAPKTTTIANHFVVSTLRGAKRQGLDLAALLQAAGIPVELLDQPKARVYPEHFARLYQGVSASLDDEFLGLSGQRSKTGTFATLCQFIVQSDNLGEALKRTVRFYSLFEYSTRYRLEERDEQICISLEETFTDYDPDHFLLECQLVLLHRLACWLIGQRIPLLKMDFSYAPPEHVAEYDLLFHSPLCFNQASNSLFFEAHYMELPIVRSKAELQEMLQDSPGAFLVKPNSNTSASTQVRNLLQRDFEQGPTDFESIASQLHTTTHTLRRRLKDENTSFQEIKDQVRRDLAIYHLSQPQLGIEQIAQKVGFTETSTFHRAFKKWTGVTPGHYRGEYISRPDGSS